MHLVVSHFLTKTISCNYKPIGNTAKIVGNSAQEIPESIRMSLGLKRILVFESEK